MTRLRWVAIVLALVTASCRASYPTAPEPTIVAVQVFYGRAMSYAAVGSSYSFIAYAIRSDGGYQDVTGAAVWSSSDSQAMRPQAVAGSFAAVGAGQVEVCAKYLSVVGTLPIPVIRTDRLVYPRLSISGGDPRTPGSKVPIYLSLQQSAISSTSVADQATWTSADPTVVMVQGGSVTAIRAGTTAIRASYNGLTADYGLSVYPRR